MAEHATKARIGHGAQFLYGNGDGPPETFTQVNEVLGFESPDEMADDVEASHLESPGKRKEYVRGMIETGEVSFDVNWDPVNWPSHAAVRTQFGAGLTQNYRFALAGGVETITFPGYIKGLRRNVPGPNEVQTATITIKVAGASTVV